MLVSLSVVSGFFPGRVTVSAPGCRELSEHANPARLLTGPVGVRVRRSIYNLKSRSA